MYVEGHSIRDVDGIPWGRETVAGLDDIRRCIEGGSCAFDARKPTAVVTVCLLESESGLDVLFEVRAAHLSHQPGEVCLPGGKIDPGESVSEAAMREIEEELLVDASQIELIGSLGETDGPGGYQLAVLAAVIHGYEGTYDPDEVAHTFTKPLDWFVENEPDVYWSRLQPQMPDDFPWDLIPGGRAYPFRGPEQDVPFYRTTDPLIWGFTARVMRALGNALRPAC